MKISKKSFQVILLCLGFFLAFVDPAAAQSATSGSGYLFIGLIVIALILAVTAIVSVTDNFMQIEAQKQGVDTAKENFSIFPRFGEMFKPKAPAITNGEGFTKLTKGFDINLAGSATGNIEKVTGVSRYALKPGDFRTLSPIPKTMVAEGDEVLAGDVIFFDKKEERVKYVAPVSGEIVEIKRGAKRAITEVIILADKEIKHKTHELPDLNNTDRETLVNFMLESGAWTLLNQRPYDIIPEIDVVPENIFISTFDTAPLGLDQNKVAKGQADAFQKGIDVLNKLTEGTVFLGINAADTSPVFTGASHVTRHWFSGKHPAGNVGVQIHHIKAINAGSSVWTLGVQEVIQLGRLMLTGQWDARRVLALTGAELNNPKYIETYAGANIGDLLKGNLKEGNNRIIDGDVLTGETSSVDDFLKDGADQITVIKEGDHYEMLGWLIPTTPKPSMSKTVPGLISRTTPLEANTNTNGERRAFVVSGQYEEVLPMDIYPQHLLKAIMAGDFEKMEGLGIYELSEEDLALCEFACVSKQPLQSILRDGLDMMREQG